MTDNMQTPLERAARALAEQDGYDPDETWEEYDRNAAASVTNGDYYEGWQDDVFPKYVRWQQYTQKARAVLEAIREPSEAMKRAGNEGLSKAGVDNVQDEDSLYCWQAMLDTAIKGE